MPTRTYLISLSLVAWVGCGGNSPPPPTPAVSPALPAVAVAARPPGSELRAWHWQDLSGHDQSLTSAAFTRDGQRMATLDWHGELHLWDAQSFQELAWRKVLDGAETGDGVWNVEFSPDGKTIAACATGKIKIVDAQTLEEVLTIKPGGTSLHYSPDGAKLFVLRHPVLRIVDPQTGEQLKRIDDVTSYRRVLGLSPDERYLVRDYRDEPLRLLDLETGQVKHELPGRKGEFFTAMFSPDGALLAASDGTTEVLVWSVETGKLLWKHDGGTTNLVFTPDGSTLIAGRGIFEAATGRHLGDLNGTILEVSPDGKMLVGRGDDEAAIRLWDVTWRRQRHEPPPPITFGDRDDVVAMATTPDGKRLATVGREKAEGPGSEAISLIQIWDAERRQLTKSIRGDPKEKNSEVIKASFSPDGKRLAAVVAINGSDNTVVSLCDAEQGKEIKRIRMDGFQPQDIVFLPDNKRFVVGCPRDSGAPIFLFDGEEQVTIGERGTSAYRLARTGDGKRLLAGGRDGMARLFDLEQRRELLNFQVCADWVQGVAISDDATVMATLGNDRPRRNVGVWDAAGHAKFTVAQETYEWTAVALTPDGKTLLIGEQTGKVRIWDVPTAKEIAVQPAHVDIGISPVHQIATYDDGKHFMTLGGYGSSRSVKVWDLTELAVDTSPPHAKAPPGPELTRLRLEPSQTLVARGVSILWRSRPTVRSSPPAAAIRVTPKERRRR